MEACGFKGNPFSHSWLEYHCAACFFVHLWPDWAWQGEESSKTGRKNRGNHKEENILFIRVWFDNNCNTKAGRAAGIVLIIFTDKGCVKNKGCLPYVTPVGPSCSIGTDPPLTPPGLIL